MLLAQDTCAFALTSATDQKQEAYSGTPEAKGGEQSVSKISVPAWVPSNQGQAHLSQEDEVVLVEGPTLPEHPRLLPLKIRWDWPGQVAHQNVGAP